MRFAIVVSRFNPTITSGLLRGAEAELDALGITGESIDVFYTAGAFELPVVAQRLARSQRYAGVICLGAVIKGDTAHFEYISTGTALGLMQAMLQTDTPISFGVLTTYNEEQALVRSNMDAHNKGREAAAACVCTARLLIDIDRRDA